MIFTKKRAYGKSFVPNPLNFGGSCALWLDAQDETSLIKSGSDITAWNDKSGNDRNFTAYGAPQYVADGINGKSAASCQGGNKYFQRTGLVLNPTSDMTLYIVHQHTTVSADQNIFNQYLGSGSEANFACELLISDHKIFFYNYPPGGYTIAPTELGINIPYIYSIRHDIGSTNKAQINGFTVGTATAATFSGTTPVYTLIGTRKNPSIIRAFEGLYGEIVAFNGVLSQAQHQLMLKYLKNHWGL